MSRDFRLSHIFPTLAVPDLEAAKAFYRDRLGFEVVEEWDFGDPPFYGGVRLDGVIVHFIGGQPEPEGFRLVIYVEDIHAFYEDCMRRGLETNDRPEPQPFGQTQFQITDNNGYGICFTETTTA